MLACTSSYSKALSHLSIRTSLQGRYCYLYFIFADTEVQIIQQPAQVTGLSEEDLKSEQCPTQATATIHWALEPLQVKDIALMGI